MAIGVSFVIFEPCNQSVVTSSFDLTVDWNLQYKRNSKADNGSNRHHKSRIWTNFGCISLHTGFVAKQNLFTDGIGRLRCLAGL